MRAVESVRKLVSERMTFMHAARFNALWRVVDALIRGKQLWLTALGRSMATTARPKHAIKAVDRLLGNRHLHRERLQVSAALTSLVVPPMSRPIVLVDTMEIRHEVVAFSAAVAFEGRAIPIHSMVIKWLNPSHEERRAFLDQLAQILPERCRPIVVTDGGFRAGWFEAIKQLGWDYVGRLRGNPKLFIDDAWATAHQLHGRAGSKARSLGQVLYSMRVCSRSLLVISAKPRSRHRQKKTRRGPARDTNYKYYRKNAHEPLLLATSLELSAKRVVQLYKTRMQIEQSFRDVKNHRWGWSLRHCGTRRHRRAELLLLVAALAALAQHLVGIAARTQGLHRRHQANTVRSRTVLSVFLLGGLALRNTDHGIVKLTHQALREALATIRRTIAAHSPARSP